MCSEVLQNCPILMFLSGERVACLQVPESFATSKYGYEQWIPTLESNQSLYCITFIALHIFILDKLCYDVKF